MADVVDSKSTAERRGGSTPSIPTKYFMNRDILIVTALSEEYVDDKYTVIYTGVGKVNASINLYSYLSKKRK